MVADFFKDLASSDEALYGPVVVPRASGADLAAGAGNAAEATAPLMPVRGPRFVCPPL
jgi:hypothetical protein